MRSSFSRALRSALLASTRTNNSSDGWIISRAFLSWGSHTLEPHERGALEPADGARRPSIPVRRRRFPPQRARRSSEGEPNLPEARLRAGGWVGGRAPPLRREPRRAPSVTGHSALDERGLAAWNARSEGGQERCSCPKVAGARTEPPRPAQCPQALGAGAPTGPGWGRLCRASVRGRRLGRRSGALLSLYTRNDRRVCYAASEPSGCRSVAASARAPSVRRRATPTGGLGGSAACGTIRALHRSGYCGLDISGRHIRDAKRAAPCEAPH